MLLGEHCGVASAALELSSKLPGMPLADFFSFAAKLDEAQIALPPPFCVQALLHVAQAKLTAGTMPIDLVDMFTLKVPQSSAQGMFKVAAPRLQNIMPLTAAVLEKALTDGCFGTLILHSMSLIDGEPAAAAGAQALRCACTAARLLALATPGAPDGFGINAGPSAGSGRNSTLPTEWAWLPDLLDVSVAIGSLTTDQNSQDDMDTLLRVQAAKSGSRKLLNTTLVKKPLWAERVRDTWKYGLGSCNIIPKIQEALRVCATDPEAWLKAAALIPSWKTEVRPGTTTNLEEMLWAVLLASWENFDAEDQGGATALLNRLRLARHLMAPNRPDSEKIDLMESSAPRPQLIAPAQRRGPKPQTQALLRLQ